MASFVTLVSVDNTEQVINVDLITRMVRHDTGEGFTAYVGKVWRPDRPQTKRPPERRSL
jgi:hypothetical protein